MIAPEYFNNHVAVEGEIIVKSVPNDAGFVLVWNPTTKKISRRTHAEVISDLSLMTTNTTQDIIGWWSIKRFFTSGGNEYNHNSLWIQSEDGSYPGITFQRGGTNTASIHYDGGTFLFNANGVSTAYSYVKVGGVYKNGSDDSYVLTGGGSHKLISDFASQTDLNNYVTLNTSQIITARKSFSGSTSDTYEGAAIEILGNGSTILPSLSFHQPGVFAGVMSYRGDDYGYYFMSANADAFRWLNALGYRKSGSNDDFVLTGGGGHKPISDFALSSQLGDYHSIDQTDSINNGSDTRTNKSWFDYNWAGTGYAGSVINFSGHPAKDYSTELFANYINDNIIGVRTRNGDTETWNPVRYLWHSGNLPNPASISQLDTKVNKSGDIMTGVLDLKSGLILSDSNSPQDWSIYQTTSGINFYVTGGSTQGDVITFSQEGYIQASGFVKTSSDNSYLLLGGGGHKPISDFATSAQLANYLPLSGGTLTGGGRIGSNGDIILQQVDTGGNATGLFWESIDNTHNISGIGTLTTDGSFEYSYMGWGASPWNTATSFYVSDNFIRYKGNDIWHSGNLPQANVDYLAYLLSVGAATIGYVDSNFQPIGQYVRVGGTGTFGNEISFGWTGTQLQATVDVTTIGNLWHTGNFNPSTKANGQENAKAIGFSSGSLPTSNGVEYPYMYYDNGLTTAYIALATQDFVSTNFHKINPSGSLTNASDSNTNRSFFDYNWAGTGYAGSVINFSGLNGNYSTELFSDYTSNTKIGIRTHNGDAVNAWTSPRWLWHDGNFNPASYVTQSSLNTQLANYATLDGVQTFSNTNTFQQSPVIPNGTLNSHAVNFGQVDAMGFMKDRGAHQDATLANTNYPVSITNWATSSGGFYGTYGLSLHLKGGNSWWYRLDFGTDGDRIEYFTGINTITMSKKGYIPLLQDGQIIATQSDVNAKVTNLENVMGVGFSSGNADAAPYFYHPVNGYRFLATQTWVSQNYMPTTHVANTITLTNILQWNDIYNYGIRVNNAFTYNTGNDIAIVDDYNGGESGLYDIQNKKMIAGRDGNYYKYGSEYGLFDGLNFAYQPKLFGIGREIGNDEDKVQLAGDLSVDTVDINHNSRQLILNPLYNTDGDVRGSRNAHIYIVTGNSVRLPSKPILGQRIEIFNESDSNIEVIHDNVGLLFYVPGFYKLTGIVGARGFIFDEKPLPAKKYDV